MPVRQPKAGCVKTSCVGRNRAVKALALNAGCAEYARELLTNRETVAKKPDTAMIVTNI